ncbi:MAG: CrcB family protein [Tetrasphaera sp.]
MSPGEQRDVLAVIAAGGALGSLARWGLAAALPHPASGIPTATWIANVTGAVVLGALMVLVTEVWPPRRYLRPFWGVGVLGGYTTFSTYVLDIHTLLRSGAGPAAGVYLAGTIVTGLLAAWLGIAAVRAAVAARGPRRRLDKEDR